LHGTHGLLIYSDVNLFGEKINIRKRREALLEAGRFTDLEVKAEKVNYTFWSRHQSAGHLLVY